MLPRLPICLCLTLLALNALAQGGLYKWVDEKGVVHYSDMPPAGKSGKQLNVAPQPPLEGPSRPRSWQEQQQDANERRHREEKAQQEQQKAAQEAEQKCLRARNALDSLKRERPLYRVTREGERAYMDDEERQRQIADWQKQADAYCR